jgi:hypothetical protein
MTHEIYVLKELRFCRLCYVYMRVLTSLSRPRECNAVIVSKVFSPSYTWPADDKPSTSFWIMQQLIRSRSHANSRKETSF